MPTAENRFLVRKTRVFPSLTSAAIFFICEALDEDALESDAVWTVKRVINLDINDSETLTVGQFDQVCDDRETLLPPALFINTRAIEYLGATEHLEIATDPSFSFENTTPFSVSMWVRTASTTVQTLVDKQDSAGGLFRGWATTLVSSKLRFLLRSDNNIGDNLIVDSNPSLALGVYVHTIVTKDATKLGSGVNIYLDGVPVNTTIVADTLVGTTVSAQPLRFGLRDSGSIPFIGFQDEVAFYNKELTAFEAATVFANARKNLLLTSLAGNITNYWHMGDGDTFPNIVDVVGGNNALMKSMVPANIVSVIP